MKKYLLLAFIAVCIGIIIPCKTVYATDITIGATSWYAWWGGDKPVEKIDPAFLYGPALSVKFNNDYNLTFVYLYGKHDCEGSGFKFKMKRNDADLALNYRLNDYFKIFGGMKYVGLSNLLMDWYGVGPGLGLSATVPLADSLFLLATASGFHLWTTEEGKDSGVKETEKSKSYGFNSTLSLAYYISSASTTISLGGRYQYIKPNYPEEGSANASVYGVTLTATYSFSI